MSAPAGVADRLRRTVARWLPASALALAALVLLAPGTRDVVTVALGVVLGLVAVGFSPLFFPRSEGDAVSHALAAESGAPLIYWRPGCAYCLRMRVALGWAGRTAVWVDVSLDERSSARVRLANGGNETVPTVFIADEAYTNPRPAWVRGHLR